MAWAIVVLALLTFTKNIYTASISSYYTFFLIEKFALTTQQAQLMLFLFLGGMAGGVMLGGLIGDRVGPLKVIWFSILGILPFTLALPHVGLAATGALAGAAVGLIMAWAFVHYSGWSDFSFSAAALPLGIGSAIATGLFFGLSPAMAAARLTPVQALRDA